MDMHEDLIDRRVVEQLIRDIGPIKSREFMLHFETEINLRVKNIKEAFKELNMSLLASEAHAFKGSASAYGAKALSLQLDVVERLAKNEDNEAFVKVGRLLELAELSKQAFIKCKID